MRGFEVIIFKLLDAWEVDRVVNELLGGGLAALGNTAVLKPVLKLRFDASAEADVNASTEVKVIATVGDCLIDLGTWSSR